MLSNYVSYAEYGRDCILRACVMILCTCTYTYLLHSIFLFFFFFCNKLRRRCAYDGVTIIIPTYFTHVCRVEWLSSSWLNMSWLLYPLYVVCITRTRYLNIIGTRVLYPCHAHSNIVVLFCENTRGGKYSLEYTSSNKLRQFFYSNRMLR